MNFSQYLPYKHRGFSWRLGFLPTNSGAEDLLSSLRSHVLTLCPGLRRCLRVSYSLVSGRTPTLGKSRLDWVFLLGDSGPSSFRSFFIWYRTSSLVTTLILHSGVFVRRPFSDPWWPSPIPPSLLLHFRLPIRCPLRLHTRSISSRHTFLSFQESLFLSSLCPLWPSFFFYSSIGVCPIT